jgi:hypothetical protein
VSPSSGGCAGRSSRFSASRSEANSGPLNVIRVSLHRSRSDHGSRNCDCNRTPNATPLCQQKTAPLTGHRLQGWPAAPPRHVRRHRLLPLLGLPFRGIHGIEDVSRGWTVRTLEPVWTVHEARFIAPCCFGVSPEGGASPGLPCAGACGICEDFPCRPTGMIRGAISAALR